MQGIIKVKKGEQGFGFITPIDGQKDLFFHFSGCLGKVDGFNSLAEGMEVSFEVQDGQKGPMAVNIAEIADLGMYEYSPYMHETPVQVNKDQRIVEGNDDSEASTIFIEIDEKTIDRERLNRNKIRIQERRNFLRSRVHSGAYYALKSKKYIEKFFDQDILTFVMSIDIRKSTEMMLKVRKSEYFGWFLAMLCKDLEEIVKRNYGIFEKFTGDGILAFFPEIFSGEHAGYYAARAASECHEAFSKRYKESHDMFDLVMIDVGLGIGIDFGKARLVAMANSFAIIGTPVVYACRFGTAPAGNTYTNISAYVEMRNKFDGSIDFTAVEFSIKHIGSIMAYATTLASTDFIPSDPCWIR